MSRRLILAFLLAPLMTPLVFIVTLISRDASWASPKSIAAVSFCTDLSHIWQKDFLGLPAFLIYRFLNWKSLIAYCCGGALIALLAIFLISRLVISWSLASADFGWCMLAGAISGLAFRLILGGAVIDRKSVAVSTEI